MTNHARPTDGTNNVAPDSNGLPGTSQVQPDLRTPGISLADHAAPKCSATDRDRLEQIARATGFSVDHDMFLSEEAFREAILQHVLRWASYQLAHGGVVQENKA